MTAPTAWQIESADIAPRFDLPWASETVAGAEHPKPRGEPGAEHSLSVSGVRFSGQAVAPAFEVRPAARAWPGNVTVAAGHDAELERHLTERPRVREALDRAMARLCEEFPGIRFVIGLYRDPEEDWAYPLVVVVPPSEVDRERLREAIDRVAVEMLERFEADAETWFSFTLRPVWPEARS